MSATDPLLCFDVLSVLICHLESGEAPSLLTDKLNQLFADTYNRRRETCARVLLKTDAKRFEWTSFGSLERKKATCTCKVPWESKSAMNQTVEAQGYSKRTCQPCSGYGLRTVKRVKNAGNITLRKKTCTLSRRLQAATRNNNQHDFSSFVNVYDHLGSFNNNISLQTMYTYDTNSLHKCSIC